MALIYEQLEAFEEKMEKAMTEATSGTVSNTQAIADLKNAVSGISTETDTILSLVTQLQGEVTDGTQAATLVAAMEQAAQSLSAKTSQMAQAVSSPNDPGTTDPGTGDSGTGTGSTGTDAGTTPTS